MELGQPGNFLYQFFYADLIRAPQIHRVTLIVSFRSQEDTFGRVFYIKKLPRRGPITPYLNLVIPYFPCINAFLDQCGNHVAARRIEIIPGPIQNLSRTLLRPTLEACELYSYPRNRFHQ